MPHASGPVLPIDDQDRGALAGELTPGEPLLWAGHPRRGIQFVRADLFLIPLSLIWCGFAVFWERNALAINHGNGIFPLWGIPFVAFGVYMVAGRFLTDAFRRQRTVYGLTAKRVIIVGGTFSREVRNLELSGLGQTSLSERPDGSGTITLGTAAKIGMPTAMMARSWPGLTPYLAPALEMIDNARPVYEAIRAAMP